MPLTKVTWASPAKINWNLRVLHRRPDGFHEIESLVSPVGLGDLLVFHPRDEPGIAISCDNPAVPLDDRNLIFQAASILAADSDGPHGATCHLVKHIPIGGGLGGGSSNAAATLLSLNELWQLGRSREELRQLAARIGSDVPLFLESGSAIIRGRGERIEPVKMAFRGYIVLLFPKFSTSTAAVYAACEPAPVNARKPANANSLAAAELDARRLMEHTFNDLEPAAQRVCPPLQLVMETATKLAGRTVRMSGSGSTLFTAFDAMEDAQVFAHSAVAQLKVETHVIQFREES
jgi:4-diphosphocytidyl-2-C-methyl-D-erythritol kinase